MQLKPHHLEILQAARASTASCITFRVIENARYGLSPIQMPLNRDIAYSTFRKRLKELAQNGYLYHHGRGGVYQLTMKGAEVLMDN